MYSNPHHRNRCAKRHCFHKCDEPKLCIEHVYVKFRILHFYSPVHYEVEIFAEKEREHGSWVYLNSQYKTVEIHLSYLSPQRKDKNPWNPAFFQRIFDRMYDPDELYECYVGKIFLKLKKIYFVEQLLSAKSNEIHPLTHVHRSISDDSREIINRLKQMVANFESGTAKLRRVKCDYDDDW